MYRLAPGADAGAAIAAFAPIFSKYNPVILIVTILPMSVMPPSSVVNY
jgi:hypothetical protein